MADVDLLWDDVRDAVRVIVADLVEVRLDVDVPDLVLVPDAVLVSDRDVVGVRDSECVGVTDRAGVRLGYGVRLGVLDCDIVGESETEPTPSKGVPTRPRLIAASIRGSTTPSGSGIKPDPALH